MTLPDLIRWHDPADVAISTGELRPLIADLISALGGQDALRRGIEAAIDAGFEADHPPCADWWAGKKENGNADQA